MLAMDEESLICDLAEEYGILNYRSLPPKLTATLAAGLRENSRIKMKINGEKTDIQTMLLAALVDGVNTIAWMLSEDGRRGRNRPKSVVSHIRGDYPGADVSVFASGEDFEKARMKLLGGDD